MNGFTIGVTHVTQLLKKNNELNLYAVSRESKIRSVGKVVFCFQRSSLARELQSLEAYNPSLLRYTADGVFIIQLLFSSKRN